MQPAVQPAIQPHKVNMTIIDVWLLSSPDEHAQDEEQVREKRRSKNRRGEKQTQHEYINSWLVNVHHTLNFLHDSIIVPVSHSLTHPLSFIVINMKIIFKCLDQN